MNQTLHLLGEAVSITALAIIASVSWNAWKRILPGVTVPVAFSRKGEPSMRLKKPLALLFMPVVASVLLLMLSANSGGIEEGAAGMVFTLQLFAAIGFSAMWIVHMRQVMDVLAKEGQLRS